jgi:APA family basic amino acid/polyamine antiporter
MGPVMAALYTAGWTIGSGIFRVPSDVAANAGSVSLSLGLWVCGGVVSLCGAYCYAELSVRIPRSGAEYVYLHAAFGPLAAFLFIWAQLLGGSAAIAAVARAFADYLAVFTPLSEVARRMVGAAAIFAFAGIAIRSSVASSRLAAVSAIGKILAALFVAGAGIFLTTGPLPTGRSMLSHGPTLGGIALAFIGIIWAYDGYSAVTVLAGEVRNPRRTLPVGLFLGLGLVTGAYLLLNWAYFQVLGFTGVAGSDAVAAKSMSAVIGPSGERAVAILVMIATLGTLTCQTLGMPRYFFAPARDRLFPQWLARVSERYTTPANAISLLAGLAIFLVSIGDFAALISMYVVIIYPLYALALIGAARLRRREGLPTGYAMPLYPLPIIVYVGTIGFICIVSVMDNPVLSFVGLAIPFTGLLTYLLFVRRRVE